MFSKGEQPYQDIPLIIRLRNVLTHYKPKTESSSEPSRLDKQLKGKFLPNQLFANPAAGIFFPNNALGHGCASWTVSTIEKFVEEFFSRMGITPNYQVVSLTLNELDSKQAGPTLGTP